MGGGSAHPAPGLAFLDVSPDELAGMDEIAQLLGVAKVTAKRYAARDDFPEPLGRLAGGRVWKREDVIEWAERTLPLPRPGRPRKGTS
jgi:predicted DNA-binding transcriptional regulator AlpA